MKEFKTFDQARAWVRKNYNPGIVKIDGVEYSVYTRHIGLTLAAIGFDKY